MPASEDLLQPLMTASGPRLPIRHAPVHGSYRTNTGKVILALSISAHDPIQTWTGGAELKNGRYGLSAGYLFGLFCLKAGRPYYLAPFFGVFSDQLREVGGRA